MKLTLQEVNDMNIPWGSRGLASKALGGCVYWSTEGIKHLYTLCRFELHRKCLTHMRVSDKDAGGAY